MELATIQRGLSRLHKMERERIAALNRVLGAIEVLEALIEEEETLDLADLAKMMGENLEVSKDG